MEAHKYRPVSGEDLSSVVYDPQTDGEQLSLLGESIVITNDAIIPDEIIGEGELIRASNATDGARVFDADGNIMMDIEIFAPGTRLGSGYWMELWMYGGEASVDLPYYDFSEAAMRGAIRAVFVARALGKIRSNRD